MNFLRDICGLTPRKKRKMVEDRLPSAKEIRALQTKGRKHISPGQSGARIRGYRIFRGAMKFGIDGGF